VRRPSPGRVMRVSGLAWIVSWFYLGLEIFHWHHVTKTLRLNPPEVPPGYPKPQPGLFLLSVLAGSAVAPVVFLVAAIVARTGVAAGAATRPVGAVAPQPPPDQREPSPEARPAPTTG
jgi:hypothetical protein